MIVAEVGKERPDLVGREAGELGGCLAFPLGGFLHDRFFQTSPL